MSEPFLTPHDPEGVVEWLLTEDALRDQSDDELTASLQVCVERLRNSLRSIARTAGITANVTDVFEGPRAAAIAMIMRERHG